MTEVNAARNSRRHKGTIVALAVILVLAAFASSVKADPKPDLGDQGNPVGGGPTAVITADGPQPCPIPLGLGTPAKVLLTATLTVPQGCALTGPSATFGPTWNNWTAKPPEYESTTAGPWQLVSDPLKTAMNPQFEGGDGTCQITLDVTVTSAPAGYYRVPVTAVATYTSTCGSSTATGHGYAVFPVGVPDFCIAAASAVTADIVGVGGTTFGSGLVTLVTITSYNGYAGAVNLSMGPLTQGSPCTPASNIFLADVFDAPPQGLPATINYSFYDPSIQKVNAQTITLAAGEVKKVVLEICVPFDLPVTFEHPFGLEVIGKDNSGVLNHTARIALTVNQITAADTLYPTAPDSEYGPTTTPTGTYRKVQTHSPAEVPAVKTYNGMQASVTFPNTDPGSASIIHCFSQDEVDIYTGGIASPGPGESDLDFGFQLGHTGNPGWKLTYNIFEDGRRRNKSPWTDYLGAGGTTLMTFETPGFPGAIQPDTNPPQALKSGVVLALKGDVYNSLGVRYSDADTETYFVSSDVWVSDNQNKFIVKRVNSIAQELGTAAPFFTDAPPNPYPEGGGSTKGFYTSGTFVQSSNPIWSNVLLFDTVTSYPWDLTRTLMEGSYPYSPYIQWSPTGELGPPETDNLYTVK